ncbi:YidB family protein [Lichenihabitans sp. Uapishka_5]|uniref:YidB family protein n=1 Tax=Lichenihabitans sp. Uapishka_5 TaxID=3037302 RepID=UPI0029E806D5|nr:YidB family protein [Lichenihabitans sp. Uapishka_5]MDX7951363.1 YidB family protein [Lichenihabitans sp. Uapishka_5]
MGILESVLGNLLGGGSNATSSPMGSVLSSILGGGVQQGGTASSGLGGALGGGGLGGLLSQFQNAGLGHVADSWVGNGPNHPVSPDQLQNVFGQDRVNDMANQAGMQPGDFLSQLSQHLPAAVNGMTPNGQLPDEGSVSV